jgi:hypothetical protein
MNKRSEQAEWLNLVDRSGPFLEPAILEGVFPQGLDRIETPRRRRLRETYEAWREAVDEKDPELEETHSAWILMVLRDMLEYEDSILISRDALDGQCVYRAPEHGIEAKPDFAVRGDDGKYRMLVSVWPPETDLEKPVSRDPWPASPLERITLLCRANEVRVGLVTDGERWMVVNAPVGANSGYAVWLARLWWQEPVTLKAFQTLLGVRRCFGPKEDTLESLLERSTEFQGEVTDTLGEQVRRAVEILIQSLGRADQDRNGELLKDVRPAELYEAGLTVMMRLVFTLCAEERGLLLLDDSTYDQYYAISTLRARLREDADRLGMEVLDKRHDAWSRILAVFRAIYGGVEHEALRMPPLGSSLFDPDRYPLLEGRAKGTTWRQTSSVPLPIDNRTVLLLLDALQVLERPGGAQLLSYRALDVEQIGHVYEGLLEYTAARMEEVTVGLIRTQKVGYPCISLRELETLKSQGHQRAVEYLAELTGRSESAINRALENRGDDDALLQLIHSCSGDEKLARRLLPFAGLIRADSWGTMLVYRPGSFSIVPGTSRRATGTHYTPKSLTEPIVQYTLEPLVYTGPAEGQTRENWKLKSPSELLDLKICDMAMGSGAFLVQACRWLAERLVEAWDIQENSGKAISVEGTVLEAAGGAELLTKDRSDRLLIARRLVASRCLYGVDLNPMAVELGKLSLWLVTMMKNRPFGFLDHAVKCGDSLLGISSLDQLEKFSLQPKKAEIVISAMNLSRYVEDAADKRRRLEALSSNQYSDIEAKNTLYAEAEASIAKLKCAANLLISVELQGLSGGGYDRAREEIANQMMHYWSNKTLDEFRQYACNQLHDRRTFHWPLEFPEVFARGGFNAFVGNPPFMGGLRITGAFETEYRDYLVEFLAKGKRGIADLVVYFLLRAFTLLNADRGILGIIATSTIAQGDTREVGMEQLFDQGAIVFRAVQSTPWPGNAVLEVAHVWLRCGSWNGQYILNGMEVRGITPFLTDRTAVTGKPFRLIANADKSFNGSFVLGMGFVMTPEEAQKLVAKNKRNRDVLFPFLNGDDINTRPDQSPSRWVINFFDWPLDRSANGSWETADEDERIRLLRDGRVPFDYPDRVAADYPDCLTIVDEKVRPERTRKNEKGEFALRYPLFLKWWIYSEKRPALYREIRKHSRILLHPLTSKHNSFEFYEPNIVFSHMTIVLTLHEWSAYALLQSEIHWHWVLYYGNKLETRPQYTPSDCFETFPFPNSMDSLGEIGSCYHEHRRWIMQTRQQGLTKTYNRFHDPGEKSEEIARLRMLHVEMDQAVGAAYGWNDLDLGHGFHETKQGIRYTISESARRTVLDRLLALNHQRYEEEVKAGLHDKDKRKSAGKRGSTRKKGEDRQQQLGFVEEEQ